MEWPAHLPLVGGGGVSAQIVNILIKHNLRNNFAHTIYHMACQHKSSTLTIHNKL